MLAPHPPLLVIYYRGKLDGKTDFLLGGEDIQGKAAIVWSHSCRRHELLYEKERDQPWKETNGGIGPSGV